jgi:hypothetical protein
MEPAMPRYFFTVRSGLEEFPDDEGVELANTRAAYRYAHLIARDLSFRCEAQRRHWRIQVSDADGANVLELPFVAADQTIGHLPPATAKLIESMSQKRFALAQAIGTARSRVYSARAARARASNRPYLISRNGQTVG